MANTNTRKVAVKYDVRKMERLRVDLNFDQVELSRELGHNPSWYSHCKLTGRMKPSDMMLVKMKYGIDIALPEPVVEEKADNKADRAEDVSIQIDYKKLSEAIQTAMQNVLPTIIDYDRLGAVMYDAIHKGGYEAMKAALEGDSHREEPVKREKRTLE